MSHLIAPDYGQQFLLPPALEDWVGAEHPVRFLREFVDALDLPALGFVIPAAAAGRPPYAPGLLLKIWLYGYYHRVRSTRRLEQACREVLPLIWLCGTLQPDHNSLWRFWHENQKALGKVFKQSVRLAVHTGAVGLALQALDGTRIQAAASTESGWSKEQMTKLLAALDESLKDIEVKVVQENEGSAASVALPAGLAERKALREQIQQGLAQLAADGRKHYHPVEPEARRMALRHQNRYAYNAQAVVDAKEGVVVACEVIRQEHDKGQLAALSQQAAQNVEMVNAPVLTVADGGYGAGSDVKAAADSDLNVLVSPAEGNPAGDEPYATQRFIYDEANNTVTCPLGQVLQRQGATKKKGVQVQRFRCHRQDCPVRAQCTRDPKGRQIEVWPHTPAVQAMRRRLEDKAKRRALHQRGQIIERCFAHIKEHDHFRRWTVWGLEAVRTQWAMICTTLNLRILYKYWRKGVGNEAGGVAMALKMRTGGSQTMAMTKEPSQPSIKKVQDWLHWHRRRIFAS